MKPDPVASLEYFGTQANNAKEAHPSGVNGDGMNGDADGASKKRARID